MEALMVAFIFMTGLRTGAAASLTWPEINLEAAEMTLQPRPGRKIKSPLRLPLSRSAVELLRGLPRIDGTDRCFPGRDRQGRPRQYQSWGAVYTRLQTASGTTGWSAHDARRGLVSLTAEHRPGEVDLIVLDRLLGHSGGSTLGTVGGIYQRASMMPQMRTAIAVWDSLLRGDNVVSLDARRA
jgi:integrase